MTWLWLITGCWGQVAKLQAEVAAAEAARRESDKDTAAAQAELRRVLTHHGPAAPASRGGNTSSAGAQPGPGKPASAAPTSPAQAKGGGASQVELMLRQQLHVRLPVLLR